MCSFCYFTFLYFSSEIFTFFVSLYKELLEPTFSACLIVLDNLYEAFGCTVMTDFTSAMFGFSKVFGW